MTNRFSSWDIIDKEQRLLEEEFKKNLALIEKLKNEKENNTDTN